MKFNEFINMFPNKIMQSNGGYMVKCPAHDDNNPSLSIAKGNKHEIVLHCYAGCDNRDILNKLGLNENDLFSTNNSKEKTNSYGATNPNITYNYTDSHNKLVHFVIRKVVNGKKEFRQGHYNDKGKQVYNIPNGFKKYPYNLPNMIEGISNGNYIYFVEGEKDAQTLISNGLIATTISGGVNGWNEDYKQHFTNSKVIILPDNDNHGFEFARKVLRSISDVTQNATIIQLPNLDIKEDVSDFIKKYGFDEFHSIVNYHLNSSKSENDIIQVAGANRSNEDNIEEIRDLIYHEGKLIDKLVADEIYKRIPLRVVVKENDKINYLFYKDGVWELFPKSVVGGLFKHWLKDRDCTERRINGIIKLLNHFPELCIDKKLINAKIKCHNFNNGTYDFENFIFYQHSPDDYFTYKVPYNYDPNLDCPNFKSVLEDYSKTKGKSESGWIELVLEMMAVSFDGDISNETVFWLVGEGGNGKSTILRILHHLIGSKLSLPDFNLEQQTDKFAKVAMMGKKLILTGDFPTHLFNAHIFKSLTGGDMQSSDTKYGDRVYFEVFGKFIFAMNQLPSFSTNENPEPIKRRVRAIPFNFRITKPDPNIEDRLINESSGILNLLINSLKKFKGRKNVFTKISNGEKMLNNYFEQLTPIEDFLNTLEYSEKSDGIFSYDLYEKYKNHMKLELGSNWENQSPLAGTRKLLPHLMNFIKTKYDVDIEKVKKYSKEAKGSQIFLKNIKWKDDDLENRV